MTRRSVATLLPALVVGLALGAFPEAIGQQEKKQGPEKKKDFDRKDFEKKKGGPGGFGGPGGQVRQVVKRFDKDGDGRLNAEERQAAREALKTEGGFGMGKGGMGGFGKGKGGKGGKGGFGKGGMGKGGFGKGRGEPTKPGPKVKPDEVKNYPQAELFAPDVLRTVFIDFENKKDWEAELAAFYRTDVEVPAAVTVDGKKYSDVGVHFRGMSSYFTVGEGSKRSLNLTFDFVDKKQRLYGHKALNLLNSHSDPSFLNTVLYSHIARKHIAAPKANLVKVVINGESWGVYVSAQQFNKDFLKQNFQTDKGARWKVPGSPRGAGGLEYLGEDVSAYKRRYSMKGKDDAKAWKALIKLCQVLNETPADKLEAALRPILDLDGALWFLALDVALVNGDGYWTRASDFSMYLDPKGKFHIVPHDMNEAFGPGGGPGFGGPGGFGGGGRGLELDPLVGLKDTSKPLRSKLLAVPALRERYLKNIRTIAEKDLDWKQLGPVVAKFRALIEKEIEADTRKLSSLAAFKAATADEAPAGGRGRGLRAFAEGRSKFLLDHAEVKKVSASVKGDKGR